MSAVPEHLYPFVGKKVAIGGHNMHYLDEGSGRVVLMVHGNPTWSFYYRHLVLALRGSHRCIVPDHIGCGWSDKPPLEQYPYTLAARVADLTAFVESLQLTEPLDLVVHDWGGMIGMAWATQNPEKVRRVTILNTGAFPLPSTKKLPDRLWLARDTKLGAALVLRLNAFAVGATYMTTEKPLSPEVRAAYVAPYDSPENRIATLRFVQDIPLSPKDPGYAIVAACAERLPDFARSHPALICWGAQDWVFDDHFLRVFQGVWPAAPCHRYEDAGHYVLEDKKDEVNRLVADFFGAP